MNTQTKQTIKLAVGVVGVVGWIGVEVRSNRKHQKRMQRIQESSEQIKAINDDLANSVIPTLDRQLETARFWDIVTRDM